MTDSLIISPQYSGPPGIANGGYVAGTMASKLGPGFSYRFKTPVPLDVPLRIDNIGGLPTLLHDGTVCVEARPALPLPTIPAQPCYREAYETPARPNPLWHNCCVCCSFELPRNAGLGVAVGQLARHRKGMVAGVWTPPKAFAEPDGSIPEALVWAALDCPGYFAWDAVEGSHVALTVRMSGRVLRRPIADEDYIIFAWSGAHISKRRRAAGSALLSSDGELMAQTAQEWIRLDQPPL